MTQPPSSTVFRTVADVASWRLCIGCGACEYACREGKVKLVDFVDQGLRPVVANGGCGGGQCTDCVSVCPGIDVAHGDPAPGAIDALRPSWGPVLEVWEGYAADPEMRFNGSSAGMASALAVFALEALGMRGAVHIGGDPNAPHVNRTLFSRTRGELLAATGSRYAPASPCDRLGTIEESDGPCVFIGKPCDVEALRKAQALRPRLERNVGLAIAIFCAGTPSTQGTLDLLRKHDVDPDEVEELRYRGRGWPGTFAVRLKGQAAWKDLATYAEAWGFLQAYRPYRCYLCPDGTGEFADVSCGDPWYREIEPGEAGTSLVVVRTERGREIVRRAMEAGHVTLSPVDPQTLALSQRELQLKRGAIWGRVTTMQALGVPAPRFRGFSLFSNWLRGRRTDAPAMNPLLTAIALAAVAVILLTPRRWALLGLTAGVLYTSAVPLFSLGGLTMYPVRVIVVAAVARAAMRGELRSIRLNRLDYAVVALYAFTVGVFLLRSSEGQVYQIGTAVDALLSYFAARALLRTSEDLRWWLRGIAVLLVPYVPLLWVESITFRNPFAAIGGVELARAGDLWVRGGRLRAVGTFGHPSLLGTFGGTFLALYAGMWFARKDRRVALVGMALCLGIVGAANSGGPALCVAAALAGWMLWPMRRDMRLVRGGLLAGLVVLSLAMKAPIWYVLARVSSITGGDGYHRAVLLDIGFRNLDRWWLAGMPLRETAKWLPYTNTTTGHVDMTNNFLQFGVTAGLGALLLLVLVLVVGFSQIGRALAAIRSSRRPDDAREPLYWGLGVMLGVHIFNWFGITYWDQTYTIWFMQLAAISGLSMEATAPATAAVASSARQVQVDEGNREVPDRQAVLHPSSARWPRQGDSPQLQAVPDALARPHAGDRTSPGEPHMTGFHDGKPLY